MGLKSQSMPVKPPQRKQNPPKCYTGKIIELKNDNVNINSADYSVMVAFDEKCLSSYCHL